MPASMQADISVLVSVACGVSMMIQATSSSATRTSPSSRLTQHCPSASDSLLGCVRCRPFHAIGAAHAPVLVGRARRCRRYRLAAPCALLPLHLELAAEAIDNKLFELKKRFHTCAICGRVLA